MARVAIALVWLGLASVCTGIGVLAGYAWALIALGIMAVVIGLAVVDVDKGGKG